MIPEASEQIRQALYASAKGDQHAFEDVCQWCSKWLTTYCRSRLRYEDLRASYEEDLHNEVLFHFRLELQRIPETTALDCLNFWFSRSENSQDTRSHDALRPKPFSADLYLLSLV